MSRTRRGVSTIVVATVMAIAAPGAAAVATAQTAPPPGTTCLVDIELSWLNLGLQPIRICI